MNSFSERHGFKNPKDLIQIDSMDNDLRNGLWNALTASYWKQAEADPAPYTGKYYITKDHNSEIYWLVYRIWRDYFKERVDNLNSNWKVTLNTLDTRFFSCKWNEVYDFIEFVANNYRSENYDETNKKFRKYCNSVLKKEVSAYQFVEGQIARFVDDVEIQEIEDSLKLPEPLISVKRHIGDALEKLSDRKAPDYRNSIKESISAVESICKLITHDKNATLSQALKNLKRSIIFHPALEGAFDKLYAYTNNEDGIRHAMCENPDLDFEDAKFMLVTCSAFVNYLAEKANKAEITLTIEK